MDWQMREKMGTDTYLFEKERRAGSLQPVVDGTWPRFIPGASLPLSYFSYARHSDTGHFYR